MTYKFDELTAQEVQLVLASLSELPIKVAGPLFSKLQTQLQAQSEPMPETAQ